MKMKVIIINAAPGIGKTSLLKRIEKSDLQDSAVIDGDDLGRIIPLQGTDRWLNLIQDNLASCAANYQEYGLRLLFISFVLPSQERVSHLMKKLMDAGISNVFHITLICDDAEIESRIVARNTSRLITVGRAKELNAEIKLLESDYRMDTSHKDADEVFRKLSNIFSEIMSQ